MEASVEKLYCYKFDLEEHCDIKQALEEWREQYPYHPINPKIKSIVALMSANESQ